MTKNFSALLESASFDNGRFAVDIPEDWMQGRTTYGGLSAALCLETLRRSFPELPPLRSAMISFIGPAGGSVEARARLLRQGKSVTFAEADLTGEKGLATRGTFAFGAARSSQFDKIFSAPPSMPDPQECEHFIPEGLGPTFVRHFDTRLAKGGRPMSGSAEHDHYIWVRHKDRNANDAVALLALADMPPPAVMPMFTAPSPVSSMTWMINLLTATPDTKDGWLLLQTRAENASEGYSSQDMLIWNFDRTLIATMRQSVAVFV